MGHYHPETPIKGDLTKFLRKGFPRYIIARIENTASNALPDIMITGHKITSWIEVKYASPDFRSKGDQELMMLRLAREGFAFYAIFYEVGKERRTYIVDPKDIGKPLDSWTYVVEGFNYQWIASHVEVIHRGNHTVG